VSFDDGKPVMKLGEFLKFAEGDAGLTNEEAKKLGEALRVSMIAGMP